MASITHPALKGDQPPPRPILPLQNGDHLTREEFERRYAAMPDIKAELIDGVVYMASPVSHLNHSRPQNRVSLWTGLYFMATPGTDAGDNGSIKLDNRNEPQPDAFLLILPSHGGRAQFDDGGYIVGAPDWVGEVAASSVSYDLHAKMQTYRRHRVQEYVVWRVLDRAIDWFVLRGGAFLPLPPSSDGYFKSEVFPGLWLDPEALIADDMTKVCYVLQLGIATPEHQEFVERLARQAAQT
jgi:Uma2 family endonuclease